MFGVKSVSEMNQQLEQLRSFFSTSSEQFKSQISLHEGKFTEEDSIEFSALLEEIKRDAQERINYFFINKFQQRSTTYETTISSFTTDGNQIRNDLDKFKEELTAATLLMKQEQNRKEQLMEFFSEKLRKNTLMKKGFNLLRDYKFKSQEAKLKDQQMNQIYRRNLMKKSFFPWRCLTYKDGYCNTVQRQADKDIQNIHQQYQEIINILKEKILETDELIRVKKAAKGEFAFALSKNLLKSISNLSMEVMNLNQMSMRDGEYSPEETQQFMDQVDNVIKEKLMKVRDYRRQLSGGEVTVENGDKRKKHISFA